MRITIDIKESKALAFLNFIQSLDFVTIKENEFALSPELEKAIDEGLKQVEEGKVFPHKEAMQQLKKKQI